MVRSIPVTTYNVQGSDPRALKRSLSSRIVGRLKERRDTPAPRLSAAAPATAGVAAPGIFVIGAQRSGTSLLCRILDSHSRIACPPESKFILPLSRVLHDRKAMAGFDSMGYGAGEVMTAMGSFARSFFDNYAASQAKARWADKTPNYVDCLDELWALFGSSTQFVIILRHGLDTAFSLADPHRTYPALDEYLDAAHGDRPVAAGLFWADKNRKIEAFRQAHPAACYRLRYEELTADPEGTLPHLFEWLGERWEPDAVDYANFPHHAGYGDPDVRRRRRIELNSGRHKQWPADVQRAVRDACGEMLEVLGYE
jgi:protein-tyrosine sulfotransferase